MDEAQSQPAAGESDGQANNETDCNSQRKYRPPRRMDERAFGGKQSSGSHDGTLEPSVMAMRPDRIASGDRGLIEALAIRGLGK